MTAITRHDLQDLRRRLLLDRRAVEEGQLDGPDILTGAIEQLTQLLNKLDGRMCDPETCPAGTHDDENGDWPNELCMNCHRPYGDPEGCA